MRKHLKLRGELSADRKYVLVEVISQTHFDFDFGYTKRAFTHGPVRLVSSGTPEYKIDLHPTSYTGPTSLYRFWVYGSDTMIQGHKHIVCLPVDLWPSLKEAVEAYNNYEF